MTAALCCPFVATEPCEWALAGICRTWNCIFFLLWPWEGVWIMMDVIEWRNGEGRFTMDKPVNLNSKFTEYLNKVGKTIKSFKFEEFSFIAWLLSWKCCRIRLLRVLKIATFHNINWHLNERKVRFLIYKKIFFLRKKRTLESME